MARHMLPVTQWVTFWMEICSPPSALEETDAQTLQPILQFAPIFKTKITDYSQTNLWQRSYGMAYSVEKRPQELSPAMYSFCLLYSTVSLSKSTQHMLWTRPQWSLEQQVLPKSWSLPVAHSCSRAAALAAPQSTVLKPPAHTPSTCPGHAQHSKEKLTDLALIPTAGTHTQGGASTGLSHLVPSMSVLQSKSPSIIHIYIAVSDSIWEQHLASTYTCTQYKPMSKLTEVLMWQWILLSFC